MFVLWVLIFSVGLSMGDYCVKWLIEKVLLIHFDILDMLSARRPESD